jgi:predicted DNA-binding protein (MmcQ/YjbR family)
MKKTPGPAALKKAMASLRAAALAFPGAYEEFPWGHSAIKVKGKTFCFLFLDDERLSLSTKLPGSGLSALMLPFAQPTGYGLGKSGWVTADFAARDKVPVDLLREWVEESYRAIAPKKLSAGLGASKK